MNGLEIPNPSERVETLSAPQIPREEVAPPQRAEISCVVCGAGTSLDEIGPTDGLWWKCPNGHAWLARAL